MSAGATFAIVFTVLLVFGGILWVALTKAPL